MPDSAQSEWLQKPERTTAIEDASVVSRWGGLDETWTASSCLVGEGAAATEAARVQAFATGPLVEERITISGRNDVSAVRGRVITVTLAGHAAYSGGAQVFCLGGDCDHGTGITRLDVLRRL